MTPTTIIASQDSSPSEKERNKLISKCNILFDKNVTEWISFKPQLGLYVYPCYCCRDMFASKVSFQDHINRRAVVIKYDCKDCGIKNMLFYNRCAFLLHARTHFSLQEGQIDLDNVDIFSLPYGLAGFLPHPEVQRIYDVQEDIINKDYYINAQFYSPVNGEIPRSIIYFKPSDLCFHCKIDDLKTIQLALKQISNNIPLCEFVNVECQRKLRKDYVLHNKSASTNAFQMKQEQPENNDCVVTMPIISKIESLNNTTSISVYPSCPECNERQSSSMNVHFLGRNIPFDEHLKCQVCRYVAASKCSLSAHKRLHENFPPFVCPECGREFDTSEQLRNHLEEVCFHLAKQVRLRCPGKKCGKLFAMTSTFATHFANHIQSLSQCDGCKKCFEKMGDYVQHANTHDSPCGMTKIYCCSACKGSSIIYEENLKQHVDYHATDRSRCMYVFICRNCRNYFRSTLTYATHILKCTKGNKTQVVKKQGFSFTLDNCSFCHNRIIFYENDKTVVCSKCRKVNILGGKSNNAKELSECNISEGTEINLCVLCDTEMADSEISRHPQICKYRNPRVVMAEMEDSSFADKLEDFYSTYKHIIDPETNGTFPKSDKTESPKSHDGKRKRKRFSQTNNRMKKAAVSPSEPEIDLQAEEPRTFDGTYYCKLCEYKDEDRLKFHEHIVVHRDISTSYQCMECGDCFVVKPTLVKHLTHYHKITDANGYLNSNDCYDKSAVQELQEIMKLGPGEARGPIKENQCRVCLQQFRDSGELSKHFRIHGMAFLMRNMK